MSYAQTRERLIDSFDDLTPQLQRAARFFIDHPEEIGLVSMRAVARAAGVQPATVSRLARALGFASYDALREPFRDRLRGDAPGYADRVRDLQQRIRATGAAALYDEVRTADVANVANTIAADRYDVFQRAVDVIAASRRVYVLGLRGAYSVAFFFHYAYRLFRDNSQLLDLRGGFLDERLRGMDGEDCLLVVSLPPYTQITKDVTDFLVDAGVRTIALTDGDLSPVARSASVVLGVSDESPSFFQSFTGALAAMHALITLLAAEAGVDAISVVTETDAELARISAYL